MRTQHRGERERERGSFVPDYTTSCLAANIALSLYFPNSAQGKIQIMGGMAVFGGGGGGVALTTQIL